MKILQEGFSALLSLYNPSHLFVSWGFGIASQMGHGAHLWSLQSAATVGELDAGEACLLERQALHLLVSLIFLFPSSVAAAASHFLPEMPLFGIP